MARKPRRTVEEALVERIGPVSAREVLGMPADRWGLLRDWITDEWRANRKAIARCMMCGGAVYIRARKFEGVNRPLFQHFGGSDPSCPWYHGRNIRPDDARAAQYQGRQESVPHRLMCELIGELVALDKRHIWHAVDEYLPPTENAFGRYPDVYVEWKGVGRFVVEVQLSNTFQTEVSDRCRHYRREGVSLLWVLRGIDTSRPLPQPVDDVIRRHRGNAFVLDKEAVKASYEQRTLVLKCYLRRREGGFDDPRLVRFDELNRSARLPFYEDRLIKPLLDEIDERRRPWLEALDTWDRYEPLGLYHFENSYSGERLVAAAFSIVAAAEGAERNYASKHDNIRGMLNTYLDEGPNKNKGTLSAYAKLLTRVIENTSQWGLLKTSCGQPFTPRHVPASRRAVAGVAFAAPSIPGSSRPVDARGAAPVRCAAGVGAATVGCRARTRHPPAPVRTFQFSDICYISTP